MLGQRARSTEKFVMDEVYVIRLSGVGREKCSSCSLVSQHAGQSEVVQTGWWQHCLCGVCMLCMAQK